MPWNNSNNNCHFYFLSFDKLQDSVHRSQFSRSQVILANNPLEFINILPQLSPYSDLMESGTVKACLSHASRYLEIFRLFCQMSDFELTSRGSSRDHIRTTQTPDDRFWFTSLYDYFYNLLYLGIFTSSPADMACLATMQGTKPHLRIR